VIDCKPARQTIVREAPTLVEIGMALHDVILVMLTAFSATAMAAVSEDRTYPLDDTPACMQRAENAVAERCVLKGSGKSNHMIPPAADDSHKPSADSLVIVEGGPQ
jgi:hypothetical protein